MKKFGLISSLFKSEPAPSPVPADKFPSIMRENVSTRIHTSTLKNGIKVITESPAFPSYISLGIYFKCGTRNESNESIGVLQSLKSRFLQNLPLAQHNLIYSLGFPVTFTYTQELSLIYSSHLPHLTKSYIHLLPELLYTPFTPDLATYTSPIYKEDIDTLLKQAILSSVLNGGLNNALFNQKNSSVTSSEINKFIEKFFSIENMCVFAGGVNDHNEFVEIVSKGLGTLSNRSKGNWVKAEYARRDVSVKVEGNFGCFAVCFRGPRIGIEDYWVFQVLKTLISQGKYDFTNERIQKVIEKFRFISDVKAELVSFSDVGVFYIRAIGEEKHQVNIIKALREIIDDLSGVSSEEVEKAKRKCKIEMLVNSDCSKKRIETLAGNFLLTGRVDELKVNLSEIEKVSSDRVRSLVKCIAKEDPSIASINSNKL